MATAIVTRTRTQYNWSVFMIEDAFGFGFIAQRSAYNAQAMAEGWVLVDDELTMNEACQLRDDLRSGEAIIEDLAV